MALRAHALTKIKASLEANISHLHVSSQARKGTTLWISCCMRVHNVARRSPRNQCAGNGLSEEAKITCEPRRWYIESNCVSTFSLNGNVHCSPCRCILLKSPGLTRWRSRFTEDTQISSPFRYTYTSRDLLLPHRGVRIHYLWFTAAVCAVHVQYAWANESCGLTLARCKNCETCVASAV